MKDGGPEQCHYAQNLQHITRQQLVEIRIYMRSGADRSGTKTKVRWYRCKEEKVEQHEVQRRQMWWIGIHRVGRYLWTDVPVKVSRIYYLGP